MKPDENVRTCHDEWVKRALALWLGDLGEVTLDVRIAGQSRRGDVLYVEGRDQPTRRRKLGTLGSLARGTMLFEPSRNPPAEFDMKSYVAKLVELEAQVRREARRAGRKRAVVQLPALCAIVPSMSRQYAKAMGIGPLAPRRRGLYMLLGAAWRTSSSPGGSRPGALTRTGQGDFHHPAPPPRRLTERPRSGRRSSATAAGRPARSSP